MLHENHSLAIDKYGKVWAWGRNSQGQLGIGNHVNSDVPVEVSLPEQARQVASYENHTIVVGVSGKVYGMGNNITGQLGNNQNLTQNLPLAIPGITTAAMATTGNIGTDILLNNGTVVRFGDSNPDLRTIAKSDIYPL